MIVKYLTYRILRFVAEFFLLMHSFCVAIVYSIGLGRRQMLGLLEKIRREHSNKYLSLLDNIIDKLRTKQAVRDKIWEEEIGPTNVSSKDSSYPKKT